MCQTARAGPADIPRMPPPTSPHNFTALSRFLAVGAVGFGVDGGLLSWLLSQGWSIAAARAVSFPAAVSVTWWLNRTWTFRQPTKAAARREYLLYFATQVGGALINLAVFFALVHLFEPLRRWPLVPLAAGAVVAIVFNFSISRWVVFSPSKP